MSEYNYTEQAAIAHTLLLTLKEDLARLAPPTWLIPNLLIKVRGGSPSQKIQDAIRELYPVTHPVTKYDLAVLIGQLSSYTVDGLASVFELRMRNTETLAQFFDLLAMVRKYVDGDNNVDTAVWEITPVEEGHRYDRPEETATAIGRGYVYSHQATIVHTTLRNLNFVVDAMPPTVLIPNPNNTDLTDISVTHQAVYRAIHDIYQNIAVGMPIQNYMVLPLIRRLGEYSVSGLATLLQLHFPTTELLAELFDLLALIQKYLEGRAGINTGVWEIRPLSNVAEEMYRGEKPTILGKARENNRAFDSFGKTTENVGIRFHGCAEHRFQPQQLQGKVMIQKIEIELDTNVVTLIHQNVCLAPVSVNTYAFMVWVGNTPSIVFTDYVVPANDTLTQSTAFGLHNPTIVNALCLMVGVDGPDLRQYAPHGATDPAQFMWQHFHVNAPNVMYQQQSPFMGQPLTPFGARPTSQYGGMPNQCFNSLATAIAQTVSITMVKVVGDESIGPTSAGSNLRVLTLENYQGERKSKVFPF